MKFSVTKRRKAGSTLLELAAEAVAEQVDYVGGHMAVVQILTCYPVVAGYMVYQGQTYTLKVWKEEDMDTRRLEVAETLQVETAD